MIKAYVLTEPLRKGFRLYPIPEDQLGHAANDIQEEILKSAHFTTVEYISYYDIIDSKDDSIDIISLLHFYIVTNEKGEPVDIEKWKIDITNVYPYFFHLTPELVQSLIRKNTKYIFNMNGYQHITPEDKQNRQKLIVMNDWVIQGGLIGKSGFLDLYDTLFKCVFFDENNQEIDISILRNLYEIKFHSE